MDYVAAKLGLCLVDNFALAESTSTHKSRTPNSCQSLLLNATSLPKPSPVLFQRISNSQKQLFSGYNGLQGVGNIVKIGYLRFLKPRIWERKRPIKSWGSKLSICQTRNKVALHFLVHSGQEQRSPSVSPEGYGVFTCVLIVPLCLCVLMWVFLNAAVFHMTENMKMYVGGT